MWWVSDLTLSQLHGGVFEISIIKPISMKLYDLNVKRRTLLGN